MFMEFTASDYLKEAIINFENEHTTDAWSNILQALKLDIDNIALYENAVKILSKLGASNEANLFQAVVNNPSSADAYNYIGQFFFDNEEYPLTISFLEKSLSLDPGNVLIEHDLAIAYTRNFDIYRSIEILEKSSANDFWHIYFLTKCRLLTEQTEQLEHSIQVLSDMIKETKEYDEGYLVAIDKLIELEECYERYKITPAPEQHIRDWHFIQHGGVILKYFDQDDEIAVAGGRYVYLREPNLEVFHTANRLKLFLNELSVNIQQIVCLEDRDSQILGLLFSKILSLPLEIYDAKNEFSNSLIVAANTACIEPHNKFTNINNQQIVLVYYHDWTSNFVFGPDIIGLMAQHYTFPWNGGYQMIEKGEESYVEIIPVDERSAELIVKDILDTSFHSDQTLFDKHLQFYKTRKEFLKGIGTIHQTDRFNMMRESPVRTSYFS